MQLDPPPRTRPSVAMLVAALAVPAHAFEFSFEGVEGSLDTTLSYGVSWRTQDIDQDIIGIANGGNAFSVNADNGDLNYVRGTYQNLGRFVSELDASSTDGRVGGFLRVTGFYDHANFKANNTDHIPLSERAREQVGRDLKLLDAYLDFNVEPAGRPTTLRIGRQVLNWGEGLFIPGGINVINPFDLSKLRTPGAELREALEPQGMVSINVGTSANTNLEAFYQFQWRRVELDRPGTFFSSNDFIGEGGNRAVLGFGEFSEFGTQIAGGLLTPAQFGVFNAVVPGVPGQTTTLQAFEPFWLNVFKGNVNLPSNTGQYGVSFSLFSEKLANTEFGFYFVNYHSRLPVLSANTASAATTAAAATQVGTALAVGIPAARALNIGVNKMGEGSNFQLDYPEDIQLFGTSFNTQVGTTGWSLQGEFSFKRDVPLQIDDFEIFAQSLTPLDTLLVAGGGFTPFNENQLNALNGGNAAPSSFVQGFIERDVSQLQLASTRSLGPTLGASTGIVVAEVAWHHVHDMPDSGYLRLEGPGTTTSGNPFQASPFGLHAGKPADSSEKFATADSWGYRLAGRLDYTNVMGLFNVSPRIQWQHDVNGVSPVGGPFLEGRKAISVGVQATYLERFVADISFTNFFGASRYNLINDRDFFSAVVKYSF